MRIRGSGSDWDAAVGVIFVLFVLYAGAYYFLVIPIGRPWGLPGEVKAIYRMELDTLVVDRSWFWKSLFAPPNWVDRRLRPHLWSEN